MSDPAVELVMTTVTTVTAFVGLGMMWSAQRVGRGARSPHTGPDSTDELGHELRPSSGSGQRSRSRN